VTALKPLPQPPAPRDAWRIRSQTLLNAFEEQLNGPQGIALGFIVMAADYLWDEQKGCTDFAKLDPRGFVSHCSELLVHDDTMRVFIRTMLPFYGFLAATSVIDATLAPKITHALRSCAAEITRPQLSAFR
jgi:hypothetical protein